MLFRSHCKKDRQAKARLLLELAKFTTASVQGNKVFRVGDLAEEALEKSSLESHGHKVKCPKCGGTEVLLLSRIRRGKPSVVTWP